MIEPFSIARLPRIEFGAGVIAKLPELLAHYGERTLLVTGARAFQSSSHWQTLSAGLERAGVTWEHLQVTDEPSPSLVDTAVQRWHGAGIQSVAGIGGGSVLDAAKAIAGLLPSGDTVMNYLEGVGAGKDYQGPALPFVAAPTTAGTGSEATKNAVLSERGPQGFKRSFRHDLLVPQYALVDPDLLATCPPRQIAANAMDALTQLLESFVSSRANPITDALAESGLNAVREGLFAWYENGPDAAAGRSCLAYAALLSGISLAQAGLGSVHGLASPLGAYFPIPHGEVCGTLVAAASRINIDAMREREPDNPARDKYARAGNILTGRLHQNPRNAREALVLVLKEWTERLELPKLRSYGVEEADFPRIVAHSRGGSMKTNPILLSDEEVTEILRQRW
ncbi:MAG: iron-containing alcohol dehydrogenase [Gammaproteobacteria bacterium]|nr:iron-containing alcohol dehydrogenase [Gammaproteobacteria bacterium]